MTERLRAAADHWRSVADLNDEKAADLIRDDQIDILIDLGVHTPHNHLTLFARKPAPIQATFLGYCGSTGLEAVDYRFSDPYLDSSELSMHSEETLRLPQSYWCYKPLESVTISQSPPAAANGFITFGCLASFPKISTAAQELWVRLLDVVPGSRILIHSQPGPHLDAVRQKLSDRVEFIPRQSREAYLRTYSRIDIALDPFPYGGGISTCEALYMGVPVVTLAGQTPVGRGGISILSNLGLPELISQTPDQYLQIAAKLADDIPRLTRFRQTLRQTMQNSPLLDARRYTRDIEAVYRSIWRRWCGNPPT
jgi:protein O-GlcNAc transferase